MIKIVQMYKKMIDTNSFLSLSWIYYFLGLIFKNAERSVL